MNKTVIDNNILFELIKDGSTFVVLANGEEIFASKSQVEAERYFIQTVQDFGG